MASRDLIGIVEAAYRVDLDDARWIHEVTAAATSLLDEGEGVAGYLIDTTGAGPAAHSPVLLGARDPWKGAWRQAWWDARVARMPAPFIGDLAGFGSPTFASQSCGALVRGAMVARLARHIPPLPLPDGVREALVVSGFDPIGRGAVLFAFRRTQALEPLPAREVDRWQRVSGHLAAAIRLRRKRAFGPLEDGGIDRASLRAATRLIDRARTRRGRAEESALTRWPPLHAGKFSVMPDGHHPASYVAIENAITGPAFGPLTVRERATVALLALGRSNKAIAYELGVSASTVSTLLSRAARRLGVDGARGLIGRTRLTVQQAGKVQSLAVSAGLSEAEAVVLSLLVAGLSDREISTLRDSTRSTVTKQVDAVYRKVGVGSRRELAARASVNAPWNGGGPSGTSPSGGITHDLPRRVSRSEP